MTKARWEASWSVQLTKNKEDEIVNYDQLNTGLKYSKTEEEVVTGESKQTIIFFSDFSFVSIEFQCVEL